MSDTISSPSPSRLIVDVATATLAENAPRWPGMNTFCAALNMAVEPLALCSPGLGWRHLGAGQRLLEHFTSAPRTRQPMWQAAGRAETDREGTRSAGGDPLHG